jgi:hypothetical protein
VSLVRHHGGEHRRQALELLRQISPYLRTHKRARAQLLLERYVLVTPHNGRYTPDLLEARTAFESSFFGIRLRATRARNVTSIDDYAISRLP